MKDTLTTGIDNEVTYTVEDSMTPAHIPAPVLSTPSMVGMIEGTCLLNVLSHLDEGETTVGTHVNISHTGPAMVGQEVRITSKLVDIKKRRLTFEIEVIAPGGSISTGTHERAVVLLERLGGG